VVLLLGVALLIFFCFRSSFTAEIAWAACSTLGAAYVTAQIVRAPNRWRNARGSLLPAVYLGAFTWFVAGFATAIAILKRH